MATPRSYTAAPAAIHPHQTPVISCQAHRDPVDMHRAAARDQFGRCRGRVPATASYYAMARGATPSPQGHHHRGISTGCRVPPALGFCDRSMRSMHRARSTAAARRPRATAESPRSAALPRNNNSPSTAPYPPRSSRAMPPPSSPGCRGTADQAPDACAARISAATAAPCRQMA